jgi:hypothetical protein
MSPTRPTGPSDGLREALGWRPVAPPDHPVLFFNPRSGGGTAVRLSLDRRARERRIEPVVLEPGQDLSALVADAVGRGADALGVAGGDGSLAVVAAAHGRARAALRLRAGRDAQPLRPRPRRAAP